MKHIGKHARRLKRSHNDLEKKFAKAWQESNDRGNTLAHLMVEGNESRPPEPTKEAAEVAATIIQWLGSPVGQEFLKEVQET
jgi:hypothetical protein